MTKERNGLDSGKKDKLGKKLPKKESKKKCTFQKSPKAFGDLKF